MVFAVIARESAAPDCAKWSRIRAAVWLHPGYEG
jgi:hypothetical protein